MGRKKHQGQAKTKMQQLINLVINWYAYKI